VISDEQQRVVRLSQRGEEGRRQFEQPFTGARVEYRKGSGRGRSSGLDLRKEGKEGVCFGLRGRGLQRAGCKGGARWRVCEGRGLA
jgi:hypothetical protein